MKTTTTAAGKRDVCVIQFRSFYSVRLSTCDGTTGRVLGIREVLSTKSRSKALREAKATAATFGASLKTTSVDMTVQ